MTNLTCYGRPVTVSEHRICGLLNQVKAYKADQSFHEHNGRKYTTSLPEDYDLHEPETSQSEMLSSSTAPRGHATFSYPPATTEYRS
jgi:hypothetical protein